MDVERLIQCVRKHEYLYDITHKEYKNTPLKALIWEAIAKELNTNGEAVKHKWKTIKDSYVKYKKQFKNATNSGRKVIDYVWSSQLKFLDDYHVTRKGRSSNVITHAALKSFLAKEAQNTPIANFSHPPSSQTQPCALSSPQDGCVCNTNSSDVEPFAVPQNESNLKRCNLTEASLENTAKKFKLQLNRHHNHDSIDLLFLSYAQTFKMFSLKQQALLKIDLAKLFANSELEELENCGYGPSGFSYAISPTSPASSTYSTGSDQDDAMTSQNNIDLKVKEENDDFLVVADDHALNTTNLENT